MANIHLNKGAIMYIVRYKWYPRAFPGDNSFTVEEMKVHGWALRQHVGRKDSHFHYIEHFPAS